MSLTLLNSYRAKTDDLLASLRTAQQILREEKASAIAAEDLVTFTEEAQVVVQGVAQTIQQQAHARIAAVVSRCLETVFEEPYTFRIAFEQKRGKTEARLYFEREGMEIDPLTASGGGVVDVAAFALRLSCILLSKPPLRRLIVLDEPFKFVSADYRARVRLMLETLAEELDLQVILVTHTTELETGTVIAL